MHIPTLMEDRYLFSYECPEAWIPLAEEAIKELEQIGEPEVAQVKEKFGTLRMYIYSVHELSDEDFAKWREIIANAERRSINVCAVCAVEGPEVEVKAQKGWYLATCPEH